MPIPIFGIYSQQTIGRGRPAIARRIATPERTRTAANGTVVDVLGRVRGFALVVSVASFAAPESAGGERDISAVSFDALPANYQLFPRGADNKVTISVSGSVEPGIYRLARLRISRDGNYWGARTVGLKINDGRARFSFEAPLTGGLVSYGFTVKLFDDQTWHPVANRRHIVVGDVYLVQGQSNAVANDFHQEQKANSNQSPWIRSFGSASSTPAEVTGGLGWQQADGEGRNGPATVGAWALAMARVLSEQHQVPIAILNGALGGSKIEQHLRDDQSPDNLDTIYGRLLYRAGQAGVRAAARALIWYQGEDDIEDAGRWARNFELLYDAWDADFPGLEQVYVFQIRDVRGSSAHQLQNIQRLLPESYPDVSVMSTTATPGFDGVHFEFAGYQALGNRLARVVGRDLYGSPAADNIDPPAIRHAYFSSAEHDALTLVFNSFTDVLVVEPGAHRRFTMSDGTPVDSAEVAGNTIKLTLQRSSRSLWVDYRSLADDSPWIVNGNRVGAPAFTVEVEPYRLSD